MHPRDEAKSTERIKHVRIICSKKLSGMCINEKNLAAVKQTFKDNLAKKINIPDVLLQYLVDEPALLAVCHDVIDNYRAHVPKTHPRNLTMHKREDLQTVRMYCTKRLSSMSQSGTKDITAVKERLKGLLKSGLPMQLKNKNLNLYTDEEILEACFFSIDQYQPNKKAKPLKYEASSIGHDESESDDESITKFLNPEYFGFFKPETATELSIPDNSKKPTLENGLS